MVAAKGIRSLIGNVEFEVLIGHAGGDAQILEFQDTEEFLKGKKK